ncbi:hypothetical protein [Pseudomonas brassicacearum]|uniref:hypothetical protein n=1 Tax=Pseudomonas brassicacearum TaxID=930166 RepID=UPI001D93B2AA|nr:hypothetical protein [Pseudomonas brassicacearum]CAH0300869.1 hypothetical protein SRABI06_04552 [Pseudomonas brassicacearum]
MNDATKNSAHLEDSSLKELLQNFNYAPLDILYKYAASLDTDDTMEILRALAKQAQQKDEVDNRVQTWEREDIQPKRTRLVVQINNHTAHAFTANTSTIDLSASEQRFIDIRPWDFLTFKFDFIYSRGLGSRSKDIYRHFIKFGDNAVGFRLDVGLRVNSSFGVITPTLTPIRTHKVTSTGTTPVDCAARITYVASEEPYSFTLELTLT